MYNRRQSRAMRSDRQANLEVRLSAQLSYNVSLLLVRGVKSGYGCRLSALCVNKIALKKERWGFLLAVHSILVLYEAYTMSGLVIIKAKRFRADVS